MWCSKKGVDCPHCGIFGECFRTGWCGLPYSYRTTAGSSSGLSDRAPTVVRRSNETEEIHDNSNYWRREGANTMPDELYINGIKYVKEK